MNNATEILDPKEGVDAALPEGREIENSRIARYMTKLDRQAASVIADDNVSLDTPIVLRRWLLIQALGVDSLPAGQRDKFYEKARNIRQLLNDLRTDLNVRNENTRKDLLESDRDRILKLEEMVVNLLEKVGGMKKT
jgi:hypothetical protein